MHKTMHMVRNLGGHICIRGSGGRKKCCYVKIVELHACPCLHMTIVSRVYSPYHCVAAELWLAALAAGFLPAASCPGSIVAVKDGLMLPPSVGMSTAHIERPLTIFDCMVFVDERPPAYVPKYRTRQKRSAGECRLREFFSPCGLIYKRHILCTYAYMLMYIYIYMYVCVYMYVCIYVCMYGSI